MRGTREKEWKSGKTELMQSCINHKKEEKKTSRPESINKEIMVKEDVI